MTKHPPRARAEDESMFYVIVPSADRRDAAREPAGAPASVTRVVGGIDVNRFEVRVTDASARGVGIRAALPLQRGSVFRLQVGFGDTLFIQVVRCRPRIGAGYDIGALFVEPGEEATPQQFVAA